MSEGKKKVFGCSLVCVFILAVVLFAIAFDRLEPTEIGIKYDGIKLQIDREHGAYNNGRYYLGIGTSFIRFPSHLVEAEFTGYSALRAWSKEGQLIVVDLGFFYRLDRDKIVDIYERYDQDYHQRMVQIATRSIKQVTIQYEATNFFEDRLEIGQHMSRELRARMAEEDMIMELFALRAVDIPDMFEAKVVSKVVKLQEKKTALHRKDTASERANIAVEEGNGQALVDERVSKATAQATRIVETAKANGLQSIAEEEATSFSQLASALDMTPAEFQKFRWSQLLSTIDSPDREMSVGIGFDGAALSFN